MSNPTITASFYSLFLHLQKSWRKWVRRWERADAGTEHGGLKLRNWRCFGSVWWNRLWRGTKLSASPGRPWLLHPSGLICICKVQIKALIVMESREMWDSPCKPDMSGRQEKSSGIARWHWTLLKEKEFKLLARQIFPTACTNELLI